MIFLIIIGASFISSAFDEFGLYSATQDVQKMINAICMLAGAIFAPVVLNLISTGKASLIPKWK
ncbi:hypothetical protein L0B53_01470 [Vibrio sp. SS-MA-C1-2]|uniref:hypothetical protein n=1 Tax=Vibrio sp. SS-MA-C1-2 TaxID=2908646 RepID=UPI001F26AB1C|nr:hypothetical protein [Vibrio sp. SS-MA-C1-2]UJF17465.1 hypothetical protein L0B53_01470 [Vibrio sp. SS-MA-C1-2]